MDLSLHTRNPIYNFLTMATVWSTAFCYFHLNFGMISAGTTDMTIPKPLLLTMMQISRKKNKFKSFLSKILVHQNLSSKRVRGLTSTPGNSSIGVKQSCVVTLFLSNECCFLKLRDSGSRYTPT